MAKKQRTVIASIYKGQQKKDKDGNYIADDNGKPVFESDYMKFRCDDQQVLGTFINALENAAKLGAKKGLSVQLQSKKSQLDGIAGALKVGSMTQDTHDYVAERINSIPDYVRFEVVLLTDKP